MVVISVLELFPEATEKEIRDTKYLLSSYRRFKRLVQELESLTERSAVQQDKYRQLKKLTEDIERAVRLIQDNEVRKIIEMRYIRGERHKIIVLHFNTMHPATVDRKLNEGIRTVANTLKDLS